MDLKSMDSIWILERGFFMDLKSMDSIWIIEHGFDMDLRAWILYAYPSVLCVFRAMTL